MVEVRDTDKTTFEDLLMDSVFHMRIAKREGEEYIFDELLDEIEMLFGLVSEINQKYQPIKQELERLAAQNIQQVKNEAAAIDDNILKDLFSAQKTAIVKWDFRTDMLETVLHIMNDYQMLPYKNPFISELGLGDFDETAEIMPNEIPANIQEQPVPQQPVQQATTFPPFPKSNQSEQIPQRPVGKKIRNE